MSYPDYSRAERIADGIVHVVGVGAALAGVILVFSFGWERMSGSVAAAMTVYCLALVLMLGASAAYHMAAHTPARPWLRRLDHAAIYLKIAGTLTPLGVLLGGIFAYSILALIWLLALKGASRKLRAAPGEMTTEWVPQVALGWLGLALIIPLSQALPEISLYLIVAGGIIYTSAVIFYCWENLRYANAIWHAFVLLATTCCFLGISGAMAGPV